MPHAAAQAKVHLRVHVSFGCDYFSCESSQQEVKVETPQRANTRRANWCWNPNQMGKYRLRFLLKGIQGVQTHKASRCSVRA